MQHCLLKTWDTESNYSANIKAEIEEYMSHYCWKCGQYLANEKFSGRDTLAISVRNVWLRNVPIAVRY